MFSSKVAAMLSVPADPDDDFVTAAADEGGGLYATKASTKKTTPSVFPMRPMKRNELLREALR